MEKLEKVIAGLVQCYYGKCTNCPYEFCNDMSCHDELNRDALELLKGYEELEDAYSKLFDRNKESEFELEDMRRRANDLEKKYAAAVEMAAIATEKAAGAEPIVRGKWEVVPGVLTPGGDPLLRCPFCRSRESEHLCGIEVTVDWDYCPKCGVRLDRR